MTEKSAIRILVLDDDPLMLKLLATLLLKRTLTKQTAGFKENLQPGRGARRHLERRTDQLLPAKVNVASGRVVGVETLVRWQHPVDVKVFPDQFIGVAEAHGLIDALTRVVLTSVIGSIGSEV